MRPIRVARFKIDLKLTTNFHCFHYNLLLCLAIHVPKPQSPMPATLAPASSASPDVINNHFVVQNVIRNYQARGHLVAKLDPLGIDRPEGEIPEATVPPQILRQHNIEHIDMNQQFTLPFTTFIGKYDTTNTIRSAQCNNQSAFPIAFTI